MDAFVITHSNCSINQAHCSNCGSTDSADLAGDQGYTACCNEPVEADAFYCEGLHNNDR